MDIKDRIKEQRAILGITQQQLAFDTGLSIDGIRSIESGRSIPNVETIRKLADRFQCTTDYLINGKVTPRVTIVKCKIPDILKEQGKTIEDMSEFLDIPVDEINKSMSTEGYLNTRILNLVAAYLKVKVDDLFEWKFE